MPKLPFMRFYPGDYLLATRSLTDTEKAIWMDILCFMWLKPENRGWLEMEMDDFSRMLGRDRLTLEITLDALKSKGICNKKFENSVIFIESRRMIKEAKSLELNNNRQKRFNAKYNARITDKKLEVRSQKSDKDFIVATPQPDVTNKPLTEIQKVVLVYKMVSGYPKEDKGWDRLNFARCSKSAKALIDFMGNWQDAADCIQDVYEKLSSKNLTVTIETVVKHASDWRRDKQETKEGGVK